MPYNRFQELHLRIANLAADSVTQSNQLISSFPNPSVVNGRRLTASERTKLIWLALDELHEFYINAKMHNLDALSSLDRVVQKEFFAFSTIDDGLPIIQDNTDYNVKRNPLYDYHYSSNATHFAIKFGTHISKGRSVEGSSFQKFLKESLHTYNFVYKRREKSLNIFSWVNEPPFNRRWTPLDNNQFSMREAGYESKVGLQENIEFTFLSEDILYRPSDLSLETHILASRPYNQIPLPPYLKPDNVLCLIPITSSLLTTLGVSKLTRAVYKINAPYPASIDALTGCAFQGVITLTSANLSSYIPDHFYLTTFEDVGKINPAHATSLAGSCYVPEEIEIHRDLLTALGVKSDSFGFDESGERIDGSNPSVDLDVPKFYDNLLFELCAKNYFSMYERNIQEATRHQQIAMAQMQAFASRALPTLITNDFAKK